MDLEWGLNPPEGALTAWGARAIYSLERLDRRRRVRGRLVSTAPVVSYLWDRQAGEGDPKEMKRLLAWVNKRGTKRLVDELAFAYVTPDSDDVVTVEDGEFRMTASPRKSYGYLYVGAWIDASMNRNRNLAEGSPCETIQTRIWIDKMELRARNELARSSRMSPAQRSAVERIGDSAHEALSDFYVSPEDRSACQGRIRPDHAGNLAGAIDPDSFRRYEMERQRIIRTNASRRMRKPPQPALAVPPRLDPPMKIQIHTRDGDYVGTWAFGVGEEQAIEEAIAHRAIRGRADAVVAWVPA